MFGGQFGSSAYPIGVDIGARSVKLLQLEHAAHGLRVAAAAIRSLPATRRVKGPSEPEAVATALGEMLGESGFRGHRCVSALPAGLVTFKNVRLPKMPPDELAAAVHWEAAERMGVPGEALMTQFFDAGEVRQGEEIREELIVMAATVEAVESHTQMLTDAGLSPVAIEVAPSALGRLLGEDDSRHDEDGPVARVIVDIGYRGSQVLITSGNRVRFCKRIDQGGEAFDRAAGAALNMTVQEVAEARARPSDNDEINRAMLEAVRPVASDLAQEIGLCVRYYSVTFRGKRPESALLVGGEAGCEGLAELLADQAGLAVMTRDPFAEIDLQRVPTLEGAGGAWAVAAGLSLRRESRLHLPVSVTRKGSTREVAA